MGQPTGSGPRKPLRRFPSLFQSLRGPPRLKAATTTWVTAHSVCSPSLAQGPASPSPRLLESAFERKPNTGVGGRGARECGEHRRRPAGVRGGSARRALRSTLRGCGSAVRALTFS